MLFAAIDIGSNAGRLLIANAYTHNNQSVVEKTTLIRVPLRLGKDVFKTGKISDERKIALIKTIKAFKLLMEVYKPIGYKAYATAALREAENGKEILQSVKKNTGIRLQCIDGKQEANIIRKNIGFVLPPENKYAMFVDVGGGSTEISITEGDRLIDLKSFQIGTIRLQADASLHNEWKSIKNWINVHQELCSEAQLIGSGGNINKINKIYGNQQSKAIFQFQLLRAYEHLRSYSLQDRIEKLGLRPDRADVIIPAAKIFLFIMHQMQAESILVPKIGLVDGMIHEQYKKYIS